MTHTGSSAPRDVLSEHSARRGTYVHPSAEVDVAAELGSNCVVEAGVYVGPTVRMGDGCTIGRNSVVVGRTQLGDRVRVGAGTVIGTASRQRVRAIGQPAAESQVAVHIGDDAILQESVTVHLPMRVNTTIGKHVSVGAHSHVAHDVEIRDNVVIAIGVRLGGFVIVGHAANVGMSVSIHPRTAVGAYSMCGMGSAVVKHVAPGATVAGVPAEFLGINKRGLVANGFTPEEISQWDKCMTGTSFEGTASREFTSFSSDCERWGRLRPWIPITAMTAG